MTRRKPPQVATLIETCIFKIADGLEGKEIGLKSSDLRNYLDMLIAVDKNDREIKVAFTKIIGSLTDENFQSELDKHSIPPTEPEKEPTK